MNIKRRKKVVDRYITKDGIERKRIYQYVQYEGQTDNKWHRVGYRDKSMKVELMDKRGNLTQAGIEWKQSILNSTDMTPQEKEWTLTKFNDYMNTRKAQKKNMTLASWESHNKNEILERMIYNYSTTPELLAEELEVDINEILNESNWNFKEGTLSIEGKIWEVDYDYDKYRGFKLVERK